ncbi:MAG TPA: DUF2569 family protein [Candidatus Eisenbacteria bacterium]|jgi:hypothetical protein|nr:DUF2569 family protein [Candidatus Eisenbacteria bacterium]
MNEENIKSGLRDPRGIGGWLAFYVWSNLLTLPFLIVVMLSYPEYLKTVPPQFLSYFPKEIPLYERLSLVLVAGFQNYGCLLLLARRRGAVEAAKQSLQAQMGFVIAKSIVLAASSRDAAGVAESFDLCLNALLFPVLWYLYFKRSRRVQNTFMPDSEEEASS